MEVNSVNNQNTKGEDNMEVKELLAEKNINLVLDPDEQDIVDKAAENEAADGQGGIIEDIINEFGDKDPKKVAWWVSIPKRDRFKCGDVVYHTDLDRFGIFIQPSKKEGLVRTRLFKLGSKSDTYTRDWYLDFEDLVLVKRGQNVRREFVETENEFLRRAGKQIRAKDLGPISESASVQA